MADIKLFRPQRLTDNPDGGGLATANEVVDGEVNNLFDDITRIDRVNGELSLRKAFAIAATPDTALYSDLHLTIQAPPLDPRVAAVLFKTNVWDDQRDNAKNYVERYLDESVISRMIPYDRQLVGQRTVLVYQRPELSLPEIGEVYALKNETALTIEYIRVQDIDHAVETFTDASGDFKVRVITLTISQPLSKEFSGSQPTRFFTVESGKSVIRKTIASDAARYKGVVTLAANAGPGDLNIKVESIFAQLVPAATSEVAVTDAQPSGSLLFVPAATATQIYSLAISNATILYAYTPIVPGSVVVSGTSKHHIDSAGILLVTTDNNAIGGTVDYQSGRLSSNSTFGSASSTSLTWLPAASVTKSSLSHQVPVEIQNRGYVYVATLRPPPTPGSTEVHFRAQGKWYVLADDGTGALVGEAGVGAGQVNFQTGAVNVTLGALPDVGSSVLFFWGGSSEYEIRTSDAAIQPPEIRHVVASGNIEPNSFSVSWQAGGITRNATDNGAGLLTGAGTGRVVYATGEFVLRPTLLPDANTTYELAYSAGATVQELFSPTVSSGSVSLASGSAPLRPGSVTIDYVAFGPNFFVSSQAARQVRDNGVGQLIGPDGAVITGSSINYTTGVINFMPDFTTQMAALERAAYANPIPGRIVSPVTGYYGTGLPSNGKWPKAVANSFVTVVFPSAGAMTLRYKLDAAVDAPETESVPAKPLMVDFLPTVSNALVPGGLLFVLGGRTYYERNGSLYYGMDVTTGAGTGAGTVDYGAGTVSITSWAGGASPALSVKALLSVVAQLPLAVVHGRTPGSPLRPGTFYIQGNRYRDGALITATADNNGNLDTSALHGYVDVNTGVFSVAFGQYVLDSSLSAGDKAEPWYDAANVAADGYIWRPDEVVPGTITFNCVVQTTLPQDPEIIKVNPVRLPLDGRVPILRAGDTLVIADALPATLPSPLTAGQVVTLPRTGLASVALYDANGLGVSDVHYTADLPAGSLTFATPLDLSAYVQPLVAIHTVEDMALCLDAQITGHVALGAPLSNSYLAGQSVVSSALILGNAQARYEYLYAQGTWTSVWSNTRIGNPPSGGGQYNDATYPLQVINKNAITQRWRLNFTSSTAFSIIGETIGVVGTGTTGANVAPINPATGEPYFTLLAAGFGAGWSTGNQVRFNTIAAGAPVWIARTVLSGPATEQDDRIRLQTRWDKD